MPLIYNKDGWLFENPQENIVHDITIDDINQLLNYAEQDEMWAAAVKNEVANRDKAIRDGTYTKKTDWLIEEFQIMQTSGAVVQMPYGPRIITFPSKRQLFRGEIQNYHRSIPSLNRMLKDGMDEKEKETIRTIAHLRKWQFVNLISNINIVPYWEAKLSDVNFDALAQHYGLATHLMDLTNDFKAALFFATCKYVPQTDSYRPLTQEDIDKSEDTKYGYIFHAPDWTIDFMNGGGFMKWENEHYNLSDPDIQKKRIYLQSGDMDGVALQIGYQPLQRCAQQSGYIYPMRNEPSLQENWHFEKMRFKQSVEVSKQVYEMMDGGKKVFPNEGVNELRNYIEQIKHSVVFTKDELEAVYDCDGIDKTIFPTISDLKKALVGYTISDGTVEIQDEPIVYQILRKCLIPSIVIMMEKICWKRLVG
ncbi:MULTISPECIES: FRG domain-containing protein [unclassified Blautia]|uniref:FRG domain-containing protein n=1 Tax=unclassified Blautia TaxID=2648079 RepID=UPI000E5D80C2|nr:MULTISPECIES: FRG domain-containing protein [unclassified Blautia]RHU32782.1 FRG domain-containing protein [Blautia sp. TF12-12AT]RHU32950.1 FRG domain-containing protein [Blautia sp. TF12-31AT]